MATITSAGIGSGIDVESLITRLMSLERQPIQQLQQRTDGLKTQLSAVGKLQSNIATLRDAVAKLTQTSGFGASKASVADTTLLSASADSGAAVGSYNIQVNRLATAQSLASSAVPQGSGIGSGTLTISFGTYSSDLSTFDADPARTSLIIPIANGEDSLESIRDKINAMKAGIVANVVTDVNGSRLVMRGVDPGAANAFQVTVSDDDGVNTDDSGLSRLAYDPTAGVNAANRKQAADNSDVLIDGVQLATSSNKIEGAIQGVTLDLQKTGSSVLTVGQDKDAVKKLITDFVDAYNAAIGQLRDLTKNEKDSSGPLKGDQGVIQIQNQLRTLVGSSTTLGGSLSRLAEIGLDPGSDGKIKIDDAKLTAALAKPDDLKGLFAGVDSGDASNSGFAQRLRELADQLLSTDGRIEARKKGISDRIDANGDRAEALERRLELVEKRLRAQYTALDGTVGKLNGLSTYLAQQLNRL